MDPTIVVTLLGGAVSALFGLIVAEWRAKDKAQKERIEKLESELSSRDDVIRKNTDALVKVAQSQETILEMVEGVMVETVHRPTHPRSTRYRDQP